MNAVDARSAVPAAAEVLPKSHSAIEYSDEDGFKKLLNRNISIPLGFGLVSVLFFLAIIYYLLSLSQWVESTDKVIGSSNVLLQLFVDHETGVRGFVITGKDEYLEPYERAVRETEAVTDHLKALLSDNSAQLKRLEAMHDNYLNWRVYAATAIEMKREGRPVEALVGSGRGKNIMDELRRESADFIAQEEAIKADRTRHARTLVVILSGGYFVVSLLFSLLTAYSGRRQLQQLAGSYRNALNQQIKQTEALRQHAWLRAGESQLADKIIGQLPLPILCQNILGFLAEYVEVVIGAVYLADEEIKFERIATYGFSREMAAIAQSFEPRESLVGQVATDRRPLFLDSVAPGYFKMNSGLGEASPVSVAILPVISDNTVLAVIELGFMRSIRARDIEFLHLINENIGAALAAAGYRRRLHDTLLNMRQLNDELQAQQEELRIANEELGEQSRALEESRLQLEAQQVELEQTNSVLEEQQETLRSNNEILQNTQHMLEGHALQLEKSSHYKSEFIANMSHELRTPLNSSLILSKLLADNASGNLTIEQVKYAEAIYAAGNDLLALINDVLDISKVEAGKLEVMPDQIVLPRILEILSQHFHALAEQKNLEFDLSVDADVPLTLYIDRQRLEQILRNLLSNAIKFTEHGNVLMRVSTAPHRHVAFAVIDTGIGLDKQHMAQVFEPFYQADSKASRKFGGVGLGLSISRQLAELLGGYLTVSSEPGTGSIFTLYVPIDYRDGAAAAPRPGLLQGRPASQLATRSAQVPAAHFADDRNCLIADRNTILIIEDEIVFAQILYDLARELNYQCLVATSADEGLELVHEHLPRAILLDMKLPDRTGLSVLASLKDDPRTRHVPVHIISVEDRSEMALRQGAVGYLVKPASREQLLSVFATVEAKVAQKMKQVLVIESAAQAQSTAQLITDADVDVVTIDSGEQALQILKTRTFDCLITDLELPDMSADELLQRMSTSEMSSFPPVIVHASRDVTRDEEEKLLHFSHSIVIKSARSPERLLDEVMLFLHKVEADLSPERRSLLQRARNRDRALEGRKILLVDDDVRNIFAITGVLENTGAQVEIGRNGLDALKKLEECADIDLVLMDIMMPEMDGYEAMQEIRKKAAFAKLPIIAVTARAMRDDQERCLQAGANDYVAKPVDMDRLISLMRVWLPKTQRA